MSEKECSWDDGVRHGLSFDQRSILLVLGLSLRRHYEATLNSAFDERMRRSLEALSELFPETE